MRRFAAVGGGLLSLSVAACGVRSSPDGRDVSRTEDASAASSSESHALRTIASIVRADRTLDAVLRPRPDGLAFANGAIEAPVEAFGDLRVRLP